jgi:hypothetical protein
MDIGLVLDIILFIMALSALCYWAFVAPIRTRRKRHYSLGSGGGRGAAWDPRIYEGRRNR